MNKPWGLWVEAVRGLRLREFMTLGFGGLDTRRHVRLAASLAQAVTLRCRFIVDRAAQPPERRQTLLKNQPVLLHAICSRLPLASAVEPAAAANTAEAPPAVLAVVCERVTILLSSCQFAILAASPWYWLFGRRRGYAMIEVPGR